MTEIDHGRRTFCGGAAFALAAMNASATEASALPQPDPRKPAASGRSAGRGSGAST